MFRSNICGCTVLLLILSVLPVSAQQAERSTSAIQPAAVTFFGCVNNATGIVRVVDSNTVCKATEHKIHWNQVGPRGPQGTQGNQGARGPQVLKAHRVLKVNRDCRGNRDPRECPWVTPPS